MAHISSRQRLPQTIVPSILLVMALVIAMAAAPSVDAASRSAAPVTTTAISFRLDAQVVQGTKAGTALAGWISGSLDSTGVLTATLTSGELPPLTVGCAPHVDFGPACGLPASANVSGKTMGSGAAATATLTVAGKGWTWILAGGAALGTAGEWTGTITQGSAYIGTWSLTPQPTTVQIDLGGQSDAKSKDKVILSASISLNVTADGRAIGTFSPINDALPTVVQGYVNANKGSVMVAIPMGRQGSVLVTGWSRPGFGGLNWKGSFVGPATGDYGIWSGQG